MRVPWIITIITKRAVIYISYYHVIQANIYTHIHTYIYIYIYIDIYIYIYIFIYTHIYIMCEYILYR